MINNATIIRRMTWIYTTISQHVVMQDDLGSLILGIFPKQLFMIFL